MLALYFKPGFQLDEQNESPTILIYAPLYAAMLVASQQSTGAPSRSTFLARSRLAVNSKHSNNGSPRICRLRLRCLSVRPFVCPRVPLQPLRQSR